MNNILSKIVESEGSCTSWASKSICALCPLSKFKRKSDGTPLSCIEALGAQNMTEEDADARYKEVAARILLDETIHEILGESDVSE
jgi:hypothetical protein